MDKLHYLIFLLIGLNFILAGLAVATVQGAYDQKRDVKLELTVNGLLNDTKTLKENQSLFSQALGNTINRSANNTDRIIVLENYDDTITSEIGKINTKIKDKFPGTTSPPDEGQSTQSTPAFLTLNMDKTEYVLGNTVTFYGMAKPNIPVILTLKLPDRTLESLAASRTTIIDGQWSTNFTLRLDDPLGTWQVYARQGATDQTKTLSFTVE